MKKNKSVNIRLIESAYRDKFKSLFTCAYLINGNERAAESVIMKVILSNPVPDDKNNDEIYSLIKDMAMKSSSAEYSALFEFSGDMSSIKSPLSEWIMTLDEKKARVLTLKYALGLSVKEICLITGENSEKVKAVLDKGRVRAYSEGKGQKLAVHHLKAACREVAESACFPPDFNAILRSVERIIEDKNASSDHVFSVKPILSYLVTGVLMAVIAAIVWMTVVLIDYFREPVQAVRPAFPIFSQSPEITEE